MSSADIQLFNTFSTCCWAAMKFKDDMKGKAKSLFYSSFVTKSDSRTSLSMVIDTIIPSLEYTIQLTPLL